MTTVTDIGARVELIPMDGHFHDISVALYLQTIGDGATVGPGFLVHSYSGLPGTDVRMRQIVDAMTVLGDLARIPDEAAKLRFACGEEHNVAVRRVFLEACKHDPSETLAPPAMGTIDRKSGLKVVVDRLGEGQYRVRTEGDDPDSQSARRVGVIVNGLLKLGDMRRIDTNGTDDCVAFPCGCSHDALVGLLLMRAPNVRAIVREQESMAARGVLSAPSARTE